MAAQKTKRKCVIRVGMTLLELLVVVSIIAILCGLLLAGIQKVRSAAARADCQNRMRQVGLALHQYHDSQFRFPAGVRNRDDPYLYLSWNARILPYLERADLWQQTVQNYAESPLTLTGPPYHITLSTPVDSYRCPNADRMTGKTPEGVDVAFTWYLGVLGSDATLANGVLYANSKVRFADITDGTSQTIIVGERPPSPDSRWGWWYAGIGQNGNGSGDMILGAAEYNNSIRLPECTHGPHQFKQGRLDNMCDTLHFWSLHSGGANFTFADGSVKFLAYSASNILPALSTRAGGESIDVP